VSPRDTYAKEDVPAAETGRHEQAITQCGDFVDSLAEWRNDDHAAIIDIRDIGVKHFFL
jgi:hypothetical protein